jgi:hypothetical protein
MCTECVTRRSPSMVNLEGISISYLRIVVRSAGLEPARVLPHSDLNAARLPIPPRPLAIGIVRGAYRNDQTDSRVVFEI